MSIFFNTISSLIEDAINDTESALQITEDGTAVNADPIQLPAVPFSGVVTSELPDLNAYSPEAPPAFVQPTTELEAAAYRAVSSALDVYQTPSLPTVTYAAAEPAPAFPVDNTSASPSMAYPEAGFVSVPTDAGLRTVTSPTPDVGIRPTLEPINFQTFDYDPVQPLDLDVPIPTDLPDPDDFSWGEELTLPVPYEDILAGLQATPEGLTALIRIQQGYASQYAKEDVFDSSRDLLRRTAARGFSDIDGTAGLAIAELHADYDKTFFQAGEQARERFYPLVRARILEAAQAAIDLERTNFTLHLAYAQKVTDVFSFNIRKHIAVYNSIVALYNQYVAATQVVISAYSAYTEAAVTQYNAKLQELANIQPIIETNSAELSMYEAQNSLFSKYAQKFSADVEQESFPVEEFAIYVNGVEKNIDIFNQNIRSYEQAVRAYAGAVNQDRAKIAAYADQIQAEGSASVVNSANWDLYSRVEGTAASVNNDIRTFNNAAQQALASEIRVFSAAAQKQDQYVNALTRQVGQLNTVAADYTRGVSAYTEFFNDKNRAIVALADATNTVEMAQADALSLQSALNAERDAAQAVIDGGLLASEATTYAGLAQSAYAIRSISAQLGSQASDSTGYTFSSSASESTDYSKSYSYKKSIVFSEEA